MVESAGSMCKTCYAASMIMVEHLGGSIIPTECS